MSEFYFTFTRISQIDLTYRKLPRIRKEKDSLEHITNQCNLCV